MANPVRGKQVFNPPDLMLPHAEPAMLISCQFWCCTNEPNAVLVFLLFGDLFLINWMQFLPAAMKHRGVGLYFFPLASLLALWVFCGVVPCRRSLLVSSPELAEVGSGHQRWWEMVWMRRLLRKSPNKLGTQEGEEGEVTPFLLNHLQTLPHRGVRHQLLLWGHKKPSCVALPNPPSRQR